MDEPLGAHTPNEMEYYLRVAFCAKCGRGPMEVKAAQPENNDEGGGLLRRAVIRGRCKRCGARATLHFYWDHDVPNDADDADCINPTRQPSRIIDLGQWVSLYHLFAEKASSAASPGASRRAARRASLCLAEALKFHGPDELPPESAFFCEASRAAFGENPAHYARTPLRELQALLPAPVHHAADAPEEPDEPHAWWRFWRK